MSVGCMEKNENNLNRVRKKCVWQNKKSKGGMNRCHKCVGWIAKNTLRWFSQIQKINMDKIAKTTYESTMKGLREKGYIFCVLKNSLVMRKDSKSDVQRSIALNQASKEPLCILLRIFHPVPLPFVFPTNFPEIGQHSLTH